MAPFELRDEALKKLREVRRSMLTLEYILAIEDLPANQQGPARMALSHVQLAILRLETAQLSDIRDQLVANEANLKAGIQSVTRALENLQGVQAILGAVSGFLGIVGRVLSLG